MPALPQGTSASSPSTNSYSKAGDLETHTHTITGNSNTWTNSYTKARQLLSEAASNAAWVFQPAVNETTSYGSANNLNQYVTVIHAANPMATLYYDGNGNLIDDGAWDFEYDAENRLTKASNPTTGKTAQYLYDPMGRRQAKIVGSVTTSFLLDGAEEIAEYTGAGGLLRRYIPGPGTDQPIAMVTPSGGGHQHSYFHTNRQGSTVAMSNDAGTVSEGPYTYDAYGQGAPSTGVPFKYTGRRLDPETGLYYYRARYYSAALGRFLQTDPIGYADQMNLYAYVGNDPGNSTDPSGKFEVSIDFIFGGVTFGYDESSDRNYIEFRAGITGAGASFSPKGALPSAPGLPPPANCTHCEYRSSEWSGPAGAIGVQLGPFTYNPIEWDDTLIVQTRPDGSQAAARASSDGWFHPDNLQNSLSSEAAGSTSKGKPKSKGVGVKANIQPWYYRWGWSWP